MTGEAGSGTLLQPELSLHRCLAKEGLLFPCHSWGSRSHSSHTLQGFTAMVYSPGQGEDDEAARAAGARLFFLCCLCEGGGGCPYTQPCGALRPCRCSAPRLSSVMSAALGEPSSICCRFIITSRSGSWRGLFQATEQSFPAVDVPSLAAGKSQWLWELCGLSCMQHVAGRVCGLAGIPLSWPRNVAEGPFEAERRFCSTPRALVVPVVGWEEERSPCASSASQQLRGCMINNLTTC